MRRFFRAHPGHADQQHASETEKAMAFLAGAAAGLHPATREGSLTVGANERLLLLGPQTTPIGVVIRVEGIMRTL